MSSHDDHASSRPRPAADRPRPSPKSSAPTERVFGLAAAHAVLWQRPGDVLHIAYSRSSRHQLGEVLREAARLRVAYREVPEDELERIAGSLHHEGICMQVRPRRSVEVTDLVQALRTPGFVLALDRVDNPHNVGALLRTAAYFGARGFLSAGGRERGLTPAAVRVAEGGAEHVPVCLVKQLDRALARFREAGVAVIGADAHEGSALAEVRWPARCVLVLGSERWGLAPEVQAQCDGFVRIIGTGAVESLNVSVAAGILMASLAQGPRRHR